MTGLDHLKEARRILIEFHKAAAREVGPKNRQTLELATAVKVLNTLIKVGERQRNYSSFFERQE